MANYKFKALLRDGEPVRGIIKSTNKEQIIDKLKQANMQPVSIKKIRVKEKKEGKSSSEKLKEKDIEKASSKIANIAKNRKKRNSGDVIKTNFFTDIFHRVKTKDIIAFSNSLYVLKKAGFNNVQALQSILDGTESANFKDIIENVLIGVESGEKMSRIMLDYPKVFPPMYVNFVKVGEDAGTLDVALLYARDYIESSTKLSKRVKSLVIPRILQVIGILALIMVSVIMGVPILQNLYDMFDSDSEIPAATMIALNVSTWLIKNWYIPVGVIIVIVASFIWYRSTPKGRYNLDKVAMKFPVVGNLVTNLTLNKFFLAMLLNLRNGMRIQESIDVSKEVTENYYFLAVVEVAKSNSLIGESWIEPFEQEKIFKPMVKEMIQIGMETELAEMMDKVNEYIKQEITESMDKFNKWLPDVTYLFVGIAMIILVLVVLVPVIQVYMGDFIKY